LDSDFSLKGAATTLLLPKPLIGLALWFYLASVPLLQLQNNIPLASILNK
jgi:hypothetical protein